MARLPGMQSWRLRMPSPYAYEQSQFYFGEYIDEDEAHSVEYQPWTYNAGLQPSFSREDTPVALPIPRDILSGYQILSNH